MLNKESNAYVTVEDLEGELGIPIVSLSSPSTVTLAPNTFYTLGTLSNNLTVSYSAVTEGYMAEYMFSFVAGNGCGVTLPSGTKYINNTAPTFTVGRTYEFDIVQGLAVVGEFY